MANKHEKRRELDFGASQTLTRKEVAPSGEVSLVGVGEAGEVQIVRVSQAMYQDLPVDGTSFWRQEFTALLTDAGGGGAWDTNIVTVPPGRVLVISGYNFACLSPLGGPGVVAVPLPDYAFVGVPGALNSPYKIFDLLIDGSSPHDISGIMFFGGVWTSNPYSGSPILNQNRCTWFGDAPTYIVARPGQRVFTRYIDRAVFGVGAVTVFVSISGRWLSQQLFDEIVATNRIS